MDDQLLPCPFCGEKPNYDADDYVNGRMVADYKVWVACENPCRGVWPAVRVHHADYDRMITAWNRRTPTPQPPVAGQGETP